MISRTYGWVQNPSDFSKLKLVVQIFDRESLHYKNLKDNLVSKYIYFDDIKDELISKLQAGKTDFSYLELVGTSKNKDGKSPKKRADAVADALIQVTILPQSANTTGKMWTDNWTSDGYLRWALSLNFVCHDRETDICSITPLGLEFSRTIDNSTEETNILRKALLSYPPATQVLNILDNSNNPVTKFTIGNNLGFVGEKGFTSYDEELILEWFSTGTDEEQKKIKSDIEGTSDKYARMISSWLEKVGFVTKNSTPVATKNGNKTGFQEFSITARGSHALKQAQGSSKNTRVSKFLTWEFLAVEGKNRDYIRTRRAYIIKFLQKTKSFKILVEKLRQLGFKDDEKIIETDLNGLTTFGLRITKNGNSIELKDIISDFSIPALNITKELKDAETEKRKADFMNKTNLSAKYIELLEIAFDGKRNRDFEIITAELFRKVYGLKSVLLGGGRKPDGIVFTDKFGIIVDTKAYGEGYSKNIGQADEMIRYIEDNKRRDINRNSTEWWADFDNSIPNNEFYFMWVSSKFVGRFQEQLDYTSSQTGTNGGALNVEQLLLGADAISKGKLDPNKLPTFINNKELHFV